MSESLGVVIAAIIAGICAIIAAIIGALNHRKLDAIHILVNSRLDEALAEITDLKKERDKPS
jgi:amino acid permease